jgi:divalent metal cation (Fe/Co/Zn/Cd) transporter
MKTWKTKLFGDNRFNFYSCIVVGLLIFGASLWFVLQAISTGATRSPIAPLLIAIYLIMVGNFGIALTNYCARVAKKLESEEERSDWESASPRG